MPNPLLITDLDNTLYNWVDYFAPSFRAMVHALSRETGMEESELIEDFRSVYARHGSLEYSYTVQELQACQKLPKEEVGRLVKIAKGAFSRTRQKHLRPYEGVKDTLVWLTEQNITIIALTNSPWFHATRRLKSLFLDRFFTLVAGEGGSGEPIDDLMQSQAIRQKLRDGTYNTTSIKRIVKLQDSELKPNSGGYERILKLFKARPEDVYVVGDSLQKDLLPTTEVADTRIWAKYGKVFSEKNYETLLQITPWSEDKINRTYISTAIEPDYTIDSFSELRKILPVRQYSLF